MKQATEKDIRVAVGVVVALARAQGYIVTVEHIETVDVVTVRRDGPANPEIVTPVPPLTPAGARIAAMVALRIDDRKVPR